MSTLSQLVDETLLALSGYGAPVARASFLADPITSLSLTITVTDGSDFGQGVVEIDSEMVYVESVAGNVLTVAPDGRGFYGTTAASHAAGARVSMNPVWPRSRVEAAINDAIEGTYPTLYGVGTTDFEWNGTQTSYELPADCEQVLVVSADILGPSMDQQFIRRYSFNAVAPVASFPSGKSIMIEEPLWRGYTVHVTYRKAPSAITTTDVFTVSGLRETAKVAVKYAACSELVSYLDTARLPVDTAVNDEYDERNAVGSASRISVQLYQRYEMELEKERRRLAATTPVPINVRTR